MEAFQQEKAVDLHAKFPLGYILFAATEWKQVVPYPSQPEGILLFDWESGNYSISTTAEGAVSLQLPHFTVKENNEVKLEYEKVGFILNRVVGARFPVVTLGKSALVFEVVATNIDNIIIAAGLERLSDGR